VDGVLLTCGNMSEIGRLWDLPKAGVPVISIDDSHQFPGVGTDRQQGFYDLTRHLIELGHRQIAYVELAIQYPSATARLAGIEEALRGVTTKISLQRVKIAEYGTVQKEAEAGAKTAEQFLQWKARPTAVLQRLRRHRIYALAQPSRLDCAPGCGSGRL